MIKDKTAETKRNPITEGIIWKEMLLFFFPILFGSLFQQVYNTADALIVGRYLGKIALSSVGGSSGQITLMIVGFFVGIASGASVLVAQYYGALDAKRVSRAVHTVMTFSLICGGVIMVLGIAFTPQVLAWMKTPQETMEGSVIYLRVYFAGMIGNMIYNVGSGVLRAVGDSKRPFIFLVVCCGMNIILDLLFILVFGMGVFGAALATILSQLASAVLVVVVMMRQNECYRLVPRELRMDPGILKKMVRIGLPAGIQALLYGISNIIIQMGVNELGTDTVAAWATYYKIDVVYWMMVSAFGIAASTFVGQNLGAERIDRMKKSIWICLLQSLIASILISTCVYMLCPWLFPLFSTDAGVIGIGVSMMRYLTPYYLLYFSIEVLLGVLRGMGDTLAPMIINAVGICFLRSVWMLAVMPRSRNMYTMMLSYPISWVLTGAALYIYTFRVLKKNGWGILP